MIERVISGGQSGADQAGWGAAKRFGVTTGGWMPRGFLTEYGPRPEFAELYSAEEHASSGYAPRTKANLAEVASRAAAVIVFDAGERTSPETKLVNDAARDLIASGLTVHMFTMKLKPAPGATARRCYRVANGAHGPDHAAASLRRSGAEILMVAGDRDSSSPRIGAFVFDYLCGVFVELGLEKRGGAPCG